MASLQDLIGTVEVWQHQKVAVFNRSAFQDGTNAASLREFVEINNRLSRRLISLTQRQDPDFWQSLVELATNCQTVIEGGKTFVDGVDRSQEGM